MKKYFLLLALFTLLYTNLNSQNYWTQLTNQFSPNCLVVSGNYIFAGTLGGGVFRSNNNGGSWSAVNNGLPNTVTSLCVSGTNIFAGIDNFGIYLSNNNGESWTNINGDLPDYVYGYVSCIATIGNNIFIGTYGTGICRTNNMGESWTEVNNGICCGIIHTLVANGNDLYAGTDGGLYVSHDLGNSWVKKSYFTDIYAVMISESFIIAAGRVGLWFTNNNGMTWDNRAGNYEIRNLVTFGNKIFGGTIGNGVLSFNNDGTNPTTVGSGIDNTVTCLLVNGLNIYAGTPAGVYYHTDQPPDALTLYTLTPSSISSGSCLGNGNIASIGVESAKRRGFCWSLTENATVADFKIEESGSFDTGLFTMPINNLSANKKYYIKAFAENDINGIIYGKEIHIVTLPLEPLCSESTEITDQGFTINWQDSDQQGSEEITHLVEVHSNASYTAHITGSPFEVSSSNSLSVGGLSPGTIYYIRVKAQNESGASDWCAKTTTTIIFPSTVETMAVSSVTSNEATVTGSINDIGSGNPFKRGFCWNTTGNPNVADFKTEETGSFNTGTFTAQLLDLVSNVNYFVRAYVENNAGITYGNEVSFITQNNSNFNKLSFQGILRDVNGNLMQSGTYSVIFNIYKDPESNSGIWSETQNVTIKNGIFNVVLGSINRIDLPFNTSYFLGIKIADSPELTPRTPIVGPVYMGGGFGR